MRNVRRSDYDISDEAVAVLSITDPRKRHEAIMELVSRT